MGRPRSPRSARSPPAAAGPGSRRRVAVPAAAGEILEHDGEAAVGQHQLGVGPAHRGVRPPALLDDPALAHLLDRAVVQPDGRAVAAGFDPSGLYLGEAA